MLIMADQLACDEFDGVMMEHFSLNSIGICAGGHKAGNKYSLSAMAHPSAHKDQMDIDRQSAETNCKLDHVL